jgi:hypothetical protein
VTLSGIPGQTPDGSNITTWPALDGKSSNTAADPFGLWEPPRLESDETISFGLPVGAESGMSSDIPIAVWTLPLTSGAEGREAGVIELHRREARIRTINVGLNQADVRIDSYRTARNRAKADFSFSAQSLQEPLSEPEKKLTYALSTLEPGGKVEQMNFGISDDIKQVAGVDWNELRRRLDEVMESVNRQLLHFAWVDTTLDGKLVARTTVNWGGDMVTLWQPELAPELTGTHCHSLQLAMASRSTNLRTILMVSQIAGKIALAVTTPLGPLQALSLGWMFVKDVVMPLLSQANQS